MLLVCQFPGILNMHHRQNRSVKLRNADIFKESLYEGSSYINHYTLSDEKYMSCTTLTGS